MCGLGLEQLMAAASRAAPPRVGTRTHQLTGNGAADLAPPRSNTGTVPDHAILGSLVGFSHSIGLLVDLIKASLFCYREKTKRKRICVVLFKEEGHDIGNDTKEEVYYIKSLHTN